MQREVPRGSPIARPHPTTSPRLPLIERRVRPDDWVAPSDGLPGEASVEVLVPVHNEWHVVRPCLEALDRFTQRPLACITVLDDGSDAFVAARLAEWTAARGVCLRRVMRNDEAQGFVRNANRGLAASGADVVVLLNSDTLVTPGWLLRLLRALEADPRAAAAMPMSNQASFHSLAIPMGWNVFEYAADLAARGPHEPFDAVTVGGFCVAFRRTALDDVGLFDEAFGRGYGEESDWCMRARAAGWRSLAVPDAFVYHRGRVSFKDHKARTFRDHNYKLFMARWARDYQRAMREYHEADALAPLRERHVRMTAPSSPPVVSAWIDRAKTGGAVYATTEAARYVRDQGGLTRLGKLVRRRGLLRSRTSRHPMPRGCSGGRRPRVTYVLEKFSISGGVLSVVQLVNRLTLLGWDAKIVTHHDHDQTHLDDFMLYHHPYVFPSSDEMIAHFPESDVIVATLWSTAEKIARVVREVRPQAVPWAFVQDDETRFFAEHDARGRQRVIDGYAAVPNRIVKSTWLGDLLAERGFDSHKVPLGMDLDVYYPERGVGDRPPHVIGMTRPRTPRRGHERMLSVFTRLARRRPDVRITLFGCPNLPEYGPVDFPHEDLGVVPPERLRALYSEAAVLVDLSDFQGFGRLGLEAMACGCATVLTNRGGINEYLRDGENALGVDPFDEEAALAAIERLLDDPSLRGRLVEAGLATARRFDCDVEARETSRLFAESLGLDAAGIA